MAKVIRTAKPSEELYRLPAQHDEPPDAELEGELPGEDSEATLDGETDGLEDGDTSASEEGPDDGAPDGGEGDAGPAVDTADAEVPGADGSGDEEPTEEEPPEPTFSAMDVEGIVEQRLGEFEARFQQEKEDAYRSGFEDGKNEGLREGQEQSRAEIDSFASVVEELGTRWRDAMRTTDVGLADLALAVARRVVGVSVEFHEEPILQAVQECLGYLQDKSRVVIRVHPDDLEAVRRHRNDWLESLESLEQLVIEGDREVARGGCIVEGKLGDVDAQVEERLERLRAVLIEEIRSEGDDE